MQSKLKRIAVLYGGWSGERPVSLTSGHKIYEAFVNAGYTACLIDVTPDIAGWLKTLQDFKPDVVMMNSLHGKGVEDGCIQGILEMLGIPYTNSNVLSSALAMDKTLSRQIFAQNNLPIPFGFTIDMSKTKPNDLPVPFPCVLKPVREGSSLGVSILKSTQDAIKAFQEWTFGKEAILEQYIPGQELSVAIMGDRALGVLELAPKSGFYDYAAKYTDGLTDHHMPARISPEVYEKVMELSLKTAKALGCQGVCRVDWRYDKDEHTHTSRHGEESQATWPSSNMDQFKLDPRVSLRLPEDDKSGSCEHPNPHHAEHTTHRHAELVSASNIDKTLNQVQGDAHIFSDDNLGLYLLEVNTQPGMTPLSIVPEIAAFVNISFTQLLEWMIDNPICPENKENLLHQNDTPAQKTA